MAEFVETAAMSTHRHWKLGLSLSPVVAETVDQVALGELLSEALVGGCGGQHGHDP